MPKPVTSQKKMVQFLNREKPATGQNTLTELCSQTGQNLLPVRRPNNTQTEQKFRKRWYNTQTVPKEPKPATSQKNIVQYSNTAKTCQQSEKDATVLKQSKTCHCQKKMVQYSNSAKICHQSEKDGTILKQNQNLSPVGKRWYNTQTVPKPVTSQKKMVQHSNSAKICHQSEKDGTILKQSKTCQQQEKDGAILQSEKDGTILKQCLNLPPVRKRWYNTQTQPKPDYSQKKMVQYSNSAKTCHQSEKDGTILKQGKTCHQSEKDGTILKQCQNLSPVRKRWYNTQTGSKTVIIEKKAVQYSSRTK